MKFCTLRKFKVEIFDACNVSDTFKDDSVMMKNVDYHDLHKSYKKYKVCLHKTKQYIVNVMSDGKKLWWWIIISTQPFKLLHRGLFTFFNTKKAADYWNVYQNKEYIILSMKSLCSLCKLMQSMIATNLSCQICSFNIQTLQIPSSIIALYYSRNK